MPMYADADPATADGLPVLGGIGFNIERMRWEIPAVRLRPPSAGPRLVHREIADRSDKNRDQTPKVVRMGHRWVDAFEYRETPRKLYAQVATRRIGHR